jgi:hypothetical protein
LRRGRLGDDVVKVQLQSKCAKSSSEFDLLYLRNIALC